MMMMMMMTMSLPLRTSFTIISAKGPIILSLYAFRSLVPVSSLEYRIVQYCDTGMAIGETELVYRQVQQWRILIPESGLEERYKM
jgi:hypothetical protein